MTLQWVDVECPDCGKVGKTAAASGEPTTTPRYVKCPTCRGTISPQADTTLC